MESGFIAMLLITDALAVIIGVIIGICYQRSISVHSKPSGNIYVEPGDSLRDPSLFLEANVPINEIASEKKVVFEVHVLPSDSHK